MYIYILLKYLHLMSFKINIRVTITKKKLCNEIICKLKTK